jgi:hypothetical protein
LGNENSWIEKLYAVSPAQWERTHPFFLCSKNSAAPPQKPPQLGPSAQQSHCHKKRKQKKI